MGNCVGSQKLPDNIFRVVNINDDKRLVRKGTMEVTPSDLIYTDSKTHEMWQWPLKHLRKYGCDGNVFSFEAGRKCPGGEGLYAFSTQRASVLFNMVAMNINQGNLQSPGESEVSPPDTSTLSFQQQRRPPSASVVPQPNYQNVDMQGVPVIDGVPVPDFTASAVTDASTPNADSPLAAPDPGPKKFQYHEVVFDKPPQEHPVPSDNPSSRTSYTKIDFRQTEVLTQKRLNGGSLSFSHAPRQLQHIPHQHPHSHSHLHGRTSTTSNSGTEAAAAAAAGHKRIRMHTFPTSPRSLSSSSLSSQNSMTESLRDIKSPRANGVLPQSAGVTPDQQTTYQNLLLSPGGPTIPEVPQPNYQNVSVESGQLTMQIPQQPNYANVTPGPNVAQQPNYHNIVCGATSTPLPTIHGDTMGNYADLDIPGRTSTPKEPNQPSYMQLEFSPGPQESSVPRPQPGGRVPQPSGRTPQLNGRASPEAAGIDISIISEPSVARVSDDQTQVNYQVLNFTAMEALSQVGKQREEERKERQQLEREKERQQQEKERERASSHHKKHK